MKQEKEVLPACVAEALCLHNRVFTTARRRPVGWILVVQHLDSSPRPLKQHLISGQNLLRCVAEIRKQGEVKVLISIGEMRDLQCLAEAINAFQACEHGG